MVIDCWSMAFSEIQVHVGPNIVVVFAIQRANHFVVGLIVIIVSMQVKERLA
jgi:hypothetical protein